MKYQKIRKFYEIVVSELEKKEDCYDNSIFLGEKLKLGISKMFVLLILPKIVWKNDDFLFSTWQNADGWTKRIWGFSGICVVYIIY